MQRRRPRATVALVALAVAAAAVATSGAVLAAPTPGTGSAPNAGAGPDVGTGGVGAADGTALDAEVKTVITAGPTPSEVPVGGEFNLTVEVRNVGDAPSSVAEVRLFLPEGIRVVGVTTGLNLSTPEDPEQRSSIAFGLSTSPPAPGESVNTTVTLRVGPNAPAGETTFTVGGHLNRTAGPTDNRSVTVTVLRDGDATTTTAGTTADGTTTGTTTTDGTTGGTTTDRTTGGTTTDRTTGGNGQSTPGFGPVAALLAVLTVLGAALYRRRAGGR